MEKRSLNGKRNLLKAMSMFIILIFVIVSQVYIYVQLIKHFKCA